MPYYDNLTLGCGIEAPDGAAMLLRLGTLFLLAYLSSLDTKYKAQFELAHPSFQIPSSGHVSTRSMMPTGPLLDGPQLMDFWQHSYPYLILVPSKFIPTIVNKAPLQPNYNAIAIPISHFQHKG